jgi:peptidoglycan-associated lipoprotein
MFKRLAPIGALLTLLLLPATAAAQDPAPRWELTAGYNYFRANIAPACNCFNTNGGNVSVAVHANGWFSVAGEFGAVRQSNVQASGRDLTVLTYQVGPRFSIRRHERVTPYFHALVGGGRASGSLYDVPLPGRTDTGPDASWALTLGGGLDVKATPRVALRLVQMDWVHTRFHNGGNNLQHNLRITAGVVFRFGQR